MRPTQDEQAFADLLEGLRQDAPADAARLARLAQALEHVRPSTGLDNHFRNNLRNRLVLEAAVHRSRFERFADAWAERNLRLRRSFKVVVATAVAALMLLAGGSIMAVAAKSVPGDWDYWAKRLHEDARLLFTRAPEARGYLQLELARENLDEVRTLLNRGQQDSAPYFTSLNLMDARTLDATRLLVAVFRATNKPLPLTRLTAFAAAQRSGLEALLDRLPPGARPPARDSIDILQSVANRVTGILNGCPCPSNPLLPPVNFPGSSASGSSDSGGAGYQGPVCPCSQYRSGSGTTTPVAGGPTTKPKPRPKPDPDKPTPQPSTPSLTDQVTGTVNGVTDQVNNLIDDVLKQLPVQPPVTVPTIPPIHL